MMVLIILIFMEVVFIAKSKGIKIMVFSGICYLEPRPACRGGSAGRAKNQEPSLPAVRQEPRAKSQPPIAILHDIH
jgi:hypothetical protein